MTAEQTTITTEPALAPVTPKQRIATLDLFRGLAGLGILAVNAGGVGGPISAYPPWP